VLGAHLPAWLWESCLVRRLRRPAALLVSKAQVRRSKKSLLAESKRTYRQLLRQHAEHMAPGEWYLASARERSFGASTSVRGLVHEDWVARGLPSLLQASSDSSRVLVRFEPLGRWGEAAAGNSMASTIVTQRNSGKVLLFDVNSKVVLRVVDDKFSDCYVNLRDRFSAHVPSVPYRVVPERTAIVEELIEGSVFGSASTGEKVAAAKKILISLSELAVHEPEGTSRDSLAATIDRTKGLAEAKRRKEEILAWLGPAPMVPSHGDLCEGNVVLRADGPTCIDFGMIGLRPSWYDGVEIALATWQADRQSRMVHDMLEVDLLRFLQLVTGGDQPEAWRRLIFLAFLSYRIDLLGRVPRRDVSILEDRDRWATDRGPTA
jgi:hypothetical protein